MRPSQKVLDLVADLVERGFSATVQAGVFPRVKVRLETDTLRADYEVSWTEIDHALFDVAANVADKLSRSIARGPVKAAPRAPRCRGCSLEEGACVCLRGFQ